MIKKTGYLLTIILIGFSLNCRALLVNETNNWGTFITIADIHFDPFSNCKPALKPCEIITNLQKADYQQWNNILATHSGPIAGLGEDTNYSLLQQTLIELKKINQKDKPQFILVLGDFLAHSFRDQYKKYSGDRSDVGYTQFVKKTLQFITYQLEQTFPNVNIYPVVGNNDTYTGDYNVVPNGAFLRDTAMTWSSFIINKNNQKNFIDLFSQNGYYAITLPYNQKILVLNTVLFSAKSHKKEMAIAANKQLQWLKQQLWLAKQNHSHVLIACHIPMGVDVFTSIKLYLFSLTEFWQPTYSNDFEKILKQFSTTIVAILPAHIHMDAYQFIPELHIPIFFTPSISPIYGNNPGFKVFTYDPKTLNIEDYVTYSYSGLFNQQKTWGAEYSFKKTYQPNCKNCKIINGMKNLQINNDLSVFYKKFYALGTDTHPILKENDWNPYYWCNINNVSRDSYEKCLKNT